MKIIMKIFSLILSISLLIILANGCKKNNKIIESKHPKADVPFDIRQSIFEKGKGIQVPLNITVPSVVLDAAGIPIVPRSTSGRLLDTDPDICENPDDYEPADWTINWITNTQSTCGNTPHTLTQNWTIKSPWELVDVSPFSSSLKSFGRIRFYNGSTVVYTTPDALISQSDIVYLGTDATYPELKVYSVTATITGIDHYYFTSGVANTIKALVKLYSDCPDAPWSVAPSYEPTILFSSVSNVNGPCQRIDLAYINPSTALNTPPDNDYCAAISGTDVLGSCPSPPDYYINLGTQMQVKKAGDPDANYTDIQTWEPGKTDFRTNGYVLYWELRWLKELTYVPNYSFPANYTFRWRNIDGTYASGTVTVSCVGEWSAPVTHYIMDF